MLHAETSSTHPVLQEKKHSLTFWKHAGSLVLLFLVIPITSLSYLFVKLKQDEALGRNG